MARWGGLAAALVVGVPLSLLVLVNVGPVGPVLGRWVGRQLSQRVGVPIHCARVHLSRRGVALTGVRASIFSGIQVTLDRLTLEPDLEFFQETGSRWRRVAASNLVVSLGGEEGEGEGGANGATPGGTGDWAGRVVRFSDRLAALGVEELTLDRASACVRGGDRCWPLIVSDSRVVQRGGSGAGWRLEAVVSSPGFGEETQVEGVFDPEAPELRLSIAGPGISLEGFRDGTGGMGWEAPAWLAHVDTFPRVGGRCTVVVRPRQGEAEVSGNLQVTGTVLDYPWLASVPVGPIDLVQRVDLAVSWNPWVVRIERWEGWVNGAAYSVRGRIEMEAEQRPFSFQVVLDDLPYQDLLDAIPADVVPRLTGVRLGGSLDLEIDLSGDLERLEDLSVSWTGDWSRLWLSHPSDVLQGEPPLEGHVFVPESSAGVVQRMVLGPGSPRWVGLEDVPHYLVDALLVSEDISFYRHHGVDTQGLAEAIRENLKAGRAVRGGSTITQQLAKNLFLTRERTLARKVQEAVLAWQLEELLGKDKILEYYLNIIEWGPGIYGVERASMHYFNKSAAELTLREAAYLCTIIPAPVRAYTYYRRGHLSPRWRRNVDELLRRMWRFGYIDDQAFERGIADTVRFWHPPGFDGGPGGKNGRRLAQPAHPFQAGVGRESARERSGPRGPMFD